MYTNKNYRTGKAVKEAVKDGIIVGVHQPNDMFGASGNGEVSLEGPHNPEPHKWYLRAKIEDFVIVRILK